MARNLVPRIPVQLSLTSLNDEGLHKLVGDVVQAAPTSKLVANNAAMAASVAAMVTKDGNLKGSNKTVADDKAKLHIDISAEAEDRTLLVGEVRSYVSFAHAGAKTPADLHGAGLVARDMSTPKNPPTAPESIDNKPPKKGRGKTVASVHETGQTRRQYVAEQSLDGINFTPLGVGRGKTRTLTGASGTKVWVRFATVRGQLQSDWCTAVFIIP